MQAVKVVDPAAGGTPKGSHVKAVENETLVLPVTNVAGATATVAPPPSKFNMVLIQLAALGTFVT